MEEFNIGDFGSAVGNTFQDVITGFGDTYTANAANAQSVVAVNNAQAIAIVQKQKNQETLIKGIILATVIFVALIGVGYIIRPLLSKIKF